MRIMNIALMFILGFAGASQGQTLISLLPVLSALGVTDGDSKGIPLSCSHDVFYKAGNVVRNVCSGATLLIIPLNCLLGHQTMNSLHFKLLP